MVGSDMQQSAVGLHRLAQAGARMAAIGYRLMEPTRQLAINLSVLTGLVLGGPGLYKLVTRSAFVIKDIAVPAELAARGLSGDVVAQQILDRIAEFDRAAGSRQDNADISGLDLDTTMPAINPPVGGFNLAAVVTELRQLLGYADTKITGEIFLVTSGMDGKSGAPQYNMRLRLAGEGAIFRNDHPTVQIEPLIEEAALQLMRHYDPIKLGYYYFRQHDYEHALEMTDEALTNPKGSNEAWAYTMRGLIARDTHHLDDAASNFREAIARAPDFWLGHASLSSVLRLDGQLTQAEAAARNAIALAPNRQEGHAALAQILLDAGKPDDALAEMQRMNIEAALLPILPTGLLNGLGNDVANVAIQRYAP